MAPDVLTFTIELPNGKYASVNNRNRGFRDPRKSDIYKYVFEAVKVAAEEEIARTGWLVADCECAATIVRVVNRRARIDAANLSKCEWDAMTAAGVWTDDRLANPSQMLVRYDDEGSHRVTIVVMKLYEPANVRIVAREGSKPEADDAEGGSVRSMRARSRRDAPKPEVSKLVNSATSRIKYTGGEIPQGKCVENGYIVDAGPILAQILKRGA